MRINRRNFISLSTFALLGSSHTNTSESHCTSSEYKEEDAKSCSEPWIEINLSSMAWNIEQIRKRVKNIPIMAVIKANAYGLGLVPIAQFLQKQGIKHLAVVKLQEAFLLRKDGNNTHILNLGPLCLEAAEDIINHNIAQSVYTDEVSALSETAMEVKKSAVVHLMIDTGLGRVGIPYYKALPFIRKVNSLKGISIAGILTALTEDDEFDNEQLRRFDQVCQQAREEGIDIGLRHAMSSDGILRHSQYLDMVRPGILIYGHYPSDKAYEERLVDLKPALQLKCRVAYVKELRPGDGVSYHRAFMAKKKELVATLPIGYSDGLPPTIADKAQVLIQGKRYPLIAAVTANHCTALITGSGDIKIGDEAVLIGTQGEETITAEELTKHAGTSVYKLLIGLNPHLPRSYNQM
jgi:alanine racemase